MEQKRNCGNNGFEMYNIGDRCEYVQYAIEIERTLHNMQKELNTCIDHRKAAMLIMRVATEFYDADWCGILDVDMEIGVWTPVSDIIHFKSVIPTVSFLFHNESLLILNIEKSRKAPLTLLDHDSSAACLICFLILAVISV